MIRAFLPLALAAGLAAAAAFAPVDRLLQIDTASITNRAPVEAPLLAQPAAGAVVDAFLRCAKFSPTFVAKNVVKLHE